MNFINLIKQNINELNRYETIINKIEKDPILIFTDLFKNKEKDILFFIISSSNNKDNLQQYLLELAIGYLKNKFNEYKFYYTYNVFPSNIICELENNKLCVINIYNKSVKPILNEEYVNIFNKKQEIEVTLEKQRKRLKELEKYKNNIYSLASNSIEYIKIWTFENAYKEKINKEYNSVYKNILELEKELIVLNTKEQSIHEKNIKFEYEQNKIINFFKNKFNYIIEEN